MKELISYLLVHLYSKKKIYLFLLYFLNFLFQEAPPISWCIFLCRCIDNFSLCTYLLIPSWQFIIYFACNIMTLVFNWYHTYSLCSVRQQLTHCARLNIHKYYLQTLSSIITIMLVCPRCGTSNLHNRCCGDGDAAVTAVAATATAAGTDINKKRVHG